jgi:hypothetical protein
LAVAVAFGAVYDGSGVLRRRFLAQVFVHVSVVDCIRSFVARRRRGRSKSSSVLGAALSMCQLRYASADALGVKHV